MNEVAINKCSICHKDIDKEDEIVCPFCLFKFHLICLEKWVSQKSICPVCFNKFLTPEISENLY
ncbi:MAG: RING finger domain-containing protein [Promethearchaeota archaeon]